MTTNTGTAESHDDQKTPGQTPEPGSTEPREPSCDLLRGLPFDGEGYPYEGGYRIPASAR